MKTRRYLTVTAAGAVSAAALFALVQLEGTPASAAAPATSAPIAKKKPPREAAAPTPKTAVAPDALAFAKTPRAPAVLATTAAPTAVSTTAAAAALVVMPDFKGKRLSAAWRDAQKLGLVLFAHDSDGDEIMAKGARDYRVRRQLTKPGTVVEPGAAAEVDVREIVAVSGY